MIRTQLMQQTVDCTVCQEVHEISRRALRDPEALMMLVDAIRADHRECTRYADNPTLAARNRDFRKRIEREEAKAAAAATPTSSRRRCRG